MKHKAVYWTPNSRNTYPMISYRVEPYYWHFQTLFRIPLNLSTTIPYLFPFPRFLFFPRAFRLLHSNPAQDTWQLSLRNTGILAFLYLLIIVKTRTRVFSPSYYVIIIKIKIQGWGKELEHFGKGWEKWEMPISKFIIYTCVHMYICRHICKCVYTHRHMVC